MFAGSQQLEPVGHKNLELSHTPALRSSLNNRGGPLPGLTSSATFLLLGIPFG